jgi:hypothetical protein
MNRHEKALIVLLRLDGLLLLSAMIPAVMPFVWMKDIHRFLGLGELVDGPLIEYLTRSLSAVYAMHGAVELSVSLDIRRYLPVAKCLAILDIVFGFWMTALDITAGMPVFWIVAEGPSIFLVGCVLLWLTGYVVGPVQNIATEQ